MSDQYLVWSIVGSAEFKYRTRLQRHSSLTVPFFVFSMISTFDSPLVMLAQLLLDGTTVRAKISKTSALVACIAKQELLH